MDARDIYIFPAPTAAPAL